jgi:hypothetical protein
MKTPERLDLVVLGEVPATAAIRREIRSRAGPQYSDNKLKSTGTMP